MTFEAVTGVHYERTRKLAPGKYLVISDTTEMPYCTRASGKDSAR